MAIVSAEVVRWIGEDNPLTADLGVSRNSIDQARYRVSLKVQDELRRLEL